MLNFAIIYILLSTLDHSIYCRSHQVYYSFYYILVNCIICQIFLPSNMLSFLSQLLCMFHLFHFLICFCCYLFILFLYFYVIPLYYFALTTVTDLILFLLNISYSLFVLEKCFEIKFSFFFHFKFNCFIKGRIKSNYITTPLFFIYILFIVIENQYSSIKISIL